MASPVSVDEAYRTLLQRGYSTTMAGNIVAEQLGLAKMPSGWTLHELNELLRVRQEYRDGKRT